MFLPGQYRIKIRNMESTKFRSQFRLSRHIWLLLLLPTVISCNKDDDAESVSTVTIISLDPGSPASLSFGQRVSITYEYNIIETEGVRIWVVPYTNGSISPRYSYTSSPLIKGTGSRDVTISITSGDSETVVDQLLIRIADSTGNYLISEYFEAVSYTFGP